MMLFYPRPVATPAGTVNLVQAGRMDLDRLMDFNDARVVSQGFHKAREELYDRIIAGDVVMFERVDGTFLGWASIMGMRSGTVLHGNVRIWFVDGTEDVQPMVMDEVATAVVHAGCDVVSIGPVPYGIGPGMDDLGYSESRLDGFQTIEAGTLMARSSTMTRRAA